MTRSKRRIMLITLCLLAIILSLLFCNSSSAGTVGTPTIPLLADSAMFIPLLLVAAGLARRRRS